MSAKSYDPAQEGAEMSFRARLEHQQHRTR